MARERLRPHREGDLPLAPVLHADPHEEPRPVSGTSSLSTARESSPQSPFPLLPVSSMLWPSASREKESAVSGAANGGA